MRLSLGSVLLGGSLISVTAAIAVGFFVLGTPDEERARRVDARRVSDLEAIVEATDLYWTRHSRLPVSLDSLAVEPGVQINTHDPMTSQSYGYQLSDSTRYEVCATFERESGETSARPAPDIWAHGTGRQCFEVEAQRIRRNERGETERLNGRS